MLTFPNVFFAEELAPTTRSFRRSFCNTGIDRWSSLGKASVIQEGQIIYRCGGTLAQKYLNICMATPVRSRGSYEHLLAIAPILLHEGGVWRRTLFWDFANNKPPVEKGKVKNCVFYTQELSNFYPLSTRIKAEHCKIACSF